MRLEASRRSGKTASTALSILETAVAHIDQVRASTSRQLGTNGFAKSASFEM